MKKISILFLILGLAQISFALPLVFKTTKTITNNEQVEILKLNTAKYSHLRISIVFDGEKRSIKSEAEIEYKSALLTQGSLEKGYQAGVISPIVYNEAKKKVDEAYQSLQSAKQHQQIEINAIEGTESILLFANNEQSANQSFSIENPPSKISLKICGKGNYKIFAWGA